MSIGTIMIISFLYTSICVSVIDFLIIRFFLTNLSNLLRFTIFNILFHFVYGYLVSIYISSSTCKRRRHLKSMKHGIKLAFATTLAYYSAYFLDVLREPFVTLFKNKGEIITKIFFIGLTSTIVSTIITYDSSKNICTQNPAEIKKNLINLDKFLNKKDKKKRKKKILVKD